MSVIFTRTTLPRELRRTWLQYMRDFDVAHNCCCSEVVSASAIPLATSGMSWVPTDRTVRRIIALLPEEKEQSLEILDKVRRRIVGRLKR